MKIWQTGLLFLALLALGVGVRYLVLIGRLSGESFFAQLPVHMAAVFLFVFLIQIGERVLRALGIRKIGSEHLQPDAANVKRGQIRFRFVSVAMCAFGAVSCFHMASEQLMHAASGFVSRAIDVGILGFGLYFLYGCVYLALYSFAYTDTHITALGLNLRARSHRWDDIIDTSSGIECRIIEFRHSGKARIPDFCAGRDELMAFAESKLNDARTPRS